MKKSNFFKASGLAAVFGLIGIGILLSAAGTETLEATNTTEFCTSCHSMQWVRKEWQESIHYKNPSGIRAECRDCHVPHPLGPKLYAKLMAAKDVWHEILGTIDTQEKFEAHRWNMATRVWKKMSESDSRECRSCHTAEAMALSDQTRNARKKHQRAMDEGITCIECHRGVAHEEPLEP